VEEDMVRVLIAEDSAVIRETLAYVLDEDPSIHVVGTAQNGLEAAAQTERLKPDVVVMDVRPEPSRCSTNQAALTIRSMPRAPSGS
jgi:chemotaxis response regulator CheB